MSATLYALVVLQGTSLSFSPGYTTAAECMQQYKGPNVACFAYDAGLSTWTAFFKLPEGGFRTVGKIASEDECNRYIDAFKDGIPTACRQLAMPVTCNVACVARVQPPAIPPKPPEVSPDPASLRDEVTPPGLAGINTNIQVGGKQYTKMAGLTWVEKESTKPDSFADVSVGPNDLQSKDQPSLLKTAEAPKKRVVVAPHYYDRAPQPLQAFIDTVMLPFDFLSYPGRRDW
jgi:uncharacterized protein YbdZ (MbtH family)